MNRDLANLKREAYSVCSARIAEKLKELQEAMNGYQAAANSETKSSAGDKYETSRAMMQLEKEKIASQMENAAKQQQMISQLSPDTTYEKAMLGSLIITDRGLFYLSVSLGMIEAGEKIFCLSPVSPLGKSFLDAKCDQKVVFNNMVYKVLDLA